jgi:hypothetical protein
MLAPRLDEEAVSILGYHADNSSPETRLLTAILERAILDYVGNEKEEAQQAHEWIFGWELNPDLEEAKYKDFSFAWVCHYLDINPFKVASYIKNMPKRGKNRVAPWYFDKTRSYSKVTSIR